MRSLVLLALLASSLGCGRAEARAWAMRPAAGNATFPSRDESGAVLAAGRTVSRQDLDEGRMAYVSFCASCHGLDGDGRGPDAVGMDPPPRDFREATFKFAAVRSGDLPNDADLIRVIGAGLAGTRMPPWGLDQTDVVRIADFLKTFPPPGCEEEPGAAPKDCARSGPWQRVAKDGHLQRVTGAPVVATPDPWVGRTEDALRKGEEIYHLTAQCTACHPSYLTRDERLTLLQRTGQTKVEERENAREPLPLAADKNPYHDEISPPDFTRDTLRSIRPGHEEEDLYRVIAAGIGGVMPAWVDALPNDELWALVHYVSRLSAKRGGG